MYARNVLISITSKHTETIVCVQNYSETMLALRGYHLRFANADGEIYQFRNIWHEADQ